MGIFELTVDTWTATTETMICTIVIQSLCLLITLYLFIIRIYHIYRTRHQLNTTRKFALLHLSQLLMMMFSLIYLFLYEWNYIHLFLPSNVMDCNLWIRSLAFSFSLTRILLFVFLMLRSSICFENTFYAVSSKLTLPIIITSIVAAIVLIIAIFNEFDAFHLLPNTGVCWRTATAMGHWLNSASHALNMVLSLVVLAIFWYKVRRVNKEIAVLQRNKTLKLDVYTTELQTEFTKHIKLGTLTVIGTVLLFFFGDLLSVLLGISYALDQTVNNILTFIMFKEHTDVYRCCCCVSQSEASDGQHVANIISFENLKKSTSSLSTKNRPSTTPNTTGTKSSSAIFTAPEDDIDGLEPITELTAFSSK